MKQGWILYYKNPNEISATHYEMNRLRLAAESRGVALDIFCPEQFELVVSRSDRNRVFIDGVKRTLPDFILPRTGSHTTYFGLAVLRQLEQLGVQTFNSSHSIECVADKLFMHQLLAQSSLPTPNTMLVKFPVDVNLVRQEIGFPLVIKNITGTEGEGIYLVETENKFLDLMELIYSNNQKSNIIIQEFIAASSGRDIRVFMVGGVAVGCMERYSSTSFKANYSRGGKVRAYTLDPELEWLATQATRLVDMDIAGVDVLIDDDGYKICEINSAPGFQGMEEVVGPIIAERMLDYIKLKL